jgi:hypothetical protein
LIQGVNEQAPTKCDVALATVWFSSSQSLH